jgi:hypothetical protein
MSDQQPSQLRKVSRQQARAQAREKRDAQGWIAALDVQDPWMAQTIRRALGNRHLTRADLESAIGISLSGGPEPMTSADNASSQEPERITIQHVLISFAGSGTKATRTREEASALAAETLERSRSGESFDDLVSSLTDDSAPGIYSLSNTNVAPRSGDEYPRGRMVPAFGDIGFSLDVGEIGMASHDPRTSPYGWHIIKRIR